jgi:hypothetical protein
MHVYPPKMDENRTRTKDIFSDLESHLLEKTKKKATVFETNPSL